MQPYKGDPECSHDPDVVTQIDCNSQIIHPVPEQSMTPEELASHSLENSLASPSPAPPTPFSLASTSQYSDKILPELSTLLFVRRSCASPVTSQARLCNTSTPITPLSFDLHTHPPSLFLQALSKLNDGSLRYTTLNHLKLSPPTNVNTNKIMKTEPSELTPPGSLTSAPPSYSFVLRQMAARRRPRLMGTFIPSPSFVQHTPPPNYAAAFDIYVDNPIPPPTPRVYNYGFVSMPAVCPACGYTGMTVVTSKITICTHLCAFILCVFFCWLCVPLPYVLRSCKDVYHYCRNCRNFLGMYCPTNPEPNNYA